MVSVPLPSSRQQRREWTDLPPLPNSSSLFAHAVAARLRPRGGNGASTDSVGVQTYGEERMSGSGGKHRPGEFGYWLAARPKAAPIGLAIGPVSESGSGLGGAGSVVGQHGRVPVNWAQNQPQPSVMQRYASFSTRTVRPAAGESGRAVGRSVVSSGVGARRRSAAAGSGTSGSTGQAYRHGRSSAGTGEGAGADSVRTQRPASNVREQTTSEATSRSEQSAHSSQSPTLPQRLPTRRGNRPAQRSTEPLSAKPEQPGPARTLANKTLSGDNPGAPVAASSSERGNGRGQVRTRVDVSSFDRRQTDSELGRANTTSAFNRPGEAISRFHSVLPTSSHHGSVSTARLPGQLGTWLRDSGRGAQEGRSLPPTGWDVFRPSSPRFIRTESNERGDSPGASVDPHPASSVNAVVGIASPTMQPSTSVASLPMAGTGGRMRTERPRITRPASSVSNSTSNHQPGAPGSQQRAPKPELPHTGETAERAIRPPLQRAIKLPSAPARYRFSADKLILPTTSDRAAAITFPVRRRTTRVASIARRVESTSTTQHPDIPTSTTQSGEVAHRPSTAQNRGVTMGSREGRPGLAPPGALGLRTAPTTATEPVLSSSANVSANEGRRGGRRASPSQFASDLTYRSGMPVGSAPVGNRRSADAGHPDTSTDPSHATHNLSAPSNRRSPGHSLHQTAALQRSTSTPAASRNADRGPSTSPFSTVAPATVGAAPVNFPAARTGTGEPHGPGLISPAQRQQQPELSASQPARSQTPLHPATTSASTSTHTSDNSVAQPASDSPRRAGHQQFFTRVDATGLDSSSLPVGGPTAAVSAARREASHVVQTALSAVKITAGGNGVRQSNRSVPVNGHADTTHFNDSNIHGGLANRHTAVTGVQRSNSRTANGPTGRIAPPARTNGHGPVQRASDMPAVSGPDEDQQKSPALSEEQTNTLMQALEQRVLSEIERRGGRHGGTF